MIKAKSPVPRVLLIVGAALIACAVAAYFGGFLFFASRFYPNTAIEGVDVSLMTEDEAARAVDDAHRVYSITVQGQGASFTLTGEEAGLEFDAHTAARLALEEQDPWLWPLDAWSDHDRSDVVGSSFDMDVLRDAVETQLLPTNAVATLPENARIFFDSGTGRFIVNPGSTGNKLDVDSVVESVAAALADRKAFLPLTSANLVKQDVPKDDPRIVGACDTANAYLSCSCNITMCDTVVASFGAREIQSWLALSDDFVVYIDEGKLALWVDTVEEMVDTYGTGRNYTRHDGKQIEVSGGTYGWISDGAELEYLICVAVYSGSCEPIEIPFKQTAVTYNPGGQDWGARYIDVDLTNQYVQFYDANGTVIWSSLCVSGAADGEHETPTGVYYINWKATMQTLRGKIDPVTLQPEYESLVYFWMPFKDNAVGLHDATWQPAFGGDRNKIGYGSHGCVNLPYDAAAQLYDLCVIGDVVVVHY